jgi:hypothetical protein
LRLRYIIKNNDTSAVLMENRMDTSNAEKQARFRKKESLKRYADKIFREMMLFHGSWLMKSTGEIQYAIDKAIELPSGWTEDDYQRAVKKLQNILLERYDNPHLLGNDVYDGRDSWNKFMTTPDPAKLHKEDKEAVENTRALAAHILSALKLSGLGDAEHAAALMEAVRFIGRSVMSNPKCPKSKAITMCLASIGPQYVRPDWFSESLTETLAWNMGEDLTRQVGQRLCEFNYKL